MFLPLRTLSGCQFVQQFRSFAQNGLPTEHRLVRQALSQHLQASFVPFGVKQLLDFLDNRGALGWI
jgi:hypothetical protein